MVPSDHVFNSILVRTHQALLQNLDDTSSTHDVLECLAACPQLCSEERRSLAAEMAPTTTPILQWLLNLEGGAAPLRAPGCPSPTPPLQQQGKSGRKGKGKGGGKGRGGGSGGGDEGRRERAAGDASRQQKPPSMATEEVEGEFFSRGRKGEGNRRTTRSTPELSQVVTHNLVVMLSALHRAPIGTPTAVARDSGRGADDVAGDGGSGDDHPLVAVGEGLAAEQELVFGLAEPLLDACLKLAAKRASPQLFSTVIEAKAMLRRRLWSSEDPSALEIQEREADVELDAAVPSIKVSLLYCGASNWVLFFA